ncbi:unnamed protein product, partial [Ectocarpus fasciculatus]
YSPNGALSATLLPSGCVVIAEAATGRQVTQLPTDATTMNLDFSPKGSFLVTWARPTTGSNTNLKVWNVSSGECVCSYTQKHYKKDLIQWTADEVICCRVVTNEVHILNGLHPEQGIVGKVYHKGVNTFKLCPLSAKPYICVFCPSAGGKNGQLALYRYNSTESAKPAGTEELVAAAASEANMLWSPTGAAVLIHTQADVDSSNNSYYGSSGLTIMSCSGCMDGSPEKDMINPLSAAVSQGKDGPIHDVRWSPMGTQFVISAGAMPCVCTLHNHKGEQIYDFGSAHRNTISWSPHGRFLALAGFGNLVGDIDFYDTQAKKIKKMSTNNAHCSVAHAWSPDSRYFMTATLAPRMNVDNGFKIFRYDGKGPIFTEHLDHCYDALWVPTLPEVYPNRARSPSRAPADGIGDASATAKAETMAAAKPAAAPAAPYRPRGSTGALSEALKRPTTQAGKVMPNKAVPGSGPAGSASSGKYVAPQRKIPGMAPGGVP